MPLVAILGAGDIGGATARALATRARVGSIRLIDERPDLAAGKALDLKQAGPISGSDTVIDGSTDILAAAGAAAIVVADAPGGEWSGDTGLAMLRRIGAFLHDGVLIFAGAGHHALMQAAFDELKLPRSKALGSAPEALASTARALISVEARASAAQVALAVIGKPERFVIPWQEAAIAGQSVTAVLTAPQISVIEARLRGLWPPGPVTLGAAAGVMCEAVLSGSRRLYSAFVSLDRDNGTKAPVCAWPVSLGPSGLERVGTPALTGRERVMIDEVLGDDNF